VPRFPPHQSGRNQCVTLRKILNGFLNKDHTAIPPARKKISREALKTGL